MPIRVLSKFSDTLGLKWPLTLELEINVNKKELNYLVTSGGTGIPEIQFSGTLYQPEN